MLNFAGHWTGTGTIQGTGDAEVICLEAGEYMISGVVFIGSVNVELLQNHYDPSGDDVLLRYRHGDSEANCLAAAWNDYVAPFASLGYVQVRLESTL